MALLTGHGSEMLLIAAGGCVVIYGEGHPYRSRLRVMAIAGLCLIAGVMSGSFVGSVVHSEIASGGSNLWLLLIALLPRRWLQSAPLSKTHYACHRQVHSSL